MVALNTADIEPNMSPIPRMGLLSICFTDQGVAICFIVEVCFLIREILDVERPSLTSPISSGLSFMRKKTTGIR